ncbi:hypothetical protein E2976_01865 (plasmid) [Paracoccus yeei]|uniref:hypothetical protein n=1 Tax=Paracoccus yeei TaxID=147645 RepID=UPI003BF850EB
MRPLSSGMATGVEDAEWETRPALSCPRAAPIDSTTSAVAVDARLLRLQPGHDLGQHHVAGESRVGGQVVRLARQRPRSGAAVQRIEEAGPPGPVGQV